MAFSHVRLERDKWYNASQVYVNGETIKNRYGPTTHKDKYGGIRDVLSLFYGEIIEIDEGDIILIKI